MYSINYKFNEKKVTLKAFVQSSCGEEDPASVLKKIPVAGVIGKVKFALCKFLKLIAAFSFS